MTPALVAGRAIMQFEDGGCSVAYTRGTGEKWWTKQPQWGKRDEYVRRGLAGDVIRAVKRS